MKDDTDTFACALTRRAARTPEDESFVATADCAQCQGPRFFDVREIPKTDLCTICTRGIVVPVPVEAAPAAENSDRYIPDAKRGIYESDEILL